ncbi:MAG: TIGR03085 family metal-binding protein [Antricoccus sp.]
MSTAQDERAQLCALLLALGPDEPTLCGDWRTRDLTAHLIIRERRLDALPGMFVPVMAKYTAKVQKATAARPWASVLTQLRQGPPRLSPAVISKVDDLMNTIEFFVHHEDVRRAQDGWQPRPADGQRYAALRSRLGSMAKLLTRQSPVGVKLDFGNGAAVVAKEAKDGHSVTVSGSPDEVTMFLFGRDAQAQVQLLGDTADIEALRQSKRGI